jgi:hypothetical protein
MVTLQQDRERRTLRPASCVSFLLAFHALRRAAPRKQKPLALRLRVFVLSLPKRRFLHRKRERRALERTGTRRNAAQDDAPRARWTMNKCNNRMLQMITDIARAESFA